MPTTIDIKDNSKKPWSADEYMNMRGVIDYGNLMQFAPYEGGYVLLACLNGPAFINDMSEKNTVYGNTKGAKAYKLDYTGYYQLQQAFIKALEQEFRGLDGIEDISSETMELTDNITSVSLISKVTQSTNSQISMRYTEKSGTLFTKYISMYLRMLKDPKTQAKTYGGFIGDIHDTNNKYRNYGFHREVFNFLYIVTDSTYLNVEKAYLLLNAQPVSAPFSDLFNVEKGDIGSKEITITFNAYVVDGATPNRLAKQYLDKMVNCAKDAKEGKININSFNYNWSFSNGDGENIKLTKYDSNGNEVEYEHIDATNDAGYIGSVDDKGIFMHSGRPTDDDSTSTT